jgi:cytochrome P450
MLKIQQRPDKASAYRGFDRIHWDEKLRSWCVFDSDLIIGIMKSPNFAAVNYAEEYAKLESRTHTSWSALIDVLRIVPLANEGERHTQLRRAFAQLISAQSPSAKIAVRQFMAVAVPPVFQATKTAELMQDLLRPISDKVFAELLGAMPPPPADSAEMSASQIFDRHLSLNRRKLVQAEVSRIADWFAHHKDELKTSPDVATALLIVGHDSLIGSLASSLVAILSDRPGIPLSDHHYPDALPRTGVPYVERVVTTNCRFDDVDFLAGDRVRLFLDAYPARENATGQAPYFGSGRHLCVGKDLSQEVWRDLCAELAKLAVRVSVRQVQFRPHDFVFNMYRTITVALDDQCP